MRETLKIAYRCLLIVLSSPDGIVALLLAYALGLSACLIERK